VAEPAQELRAAAQRLRTLAEAATPGPWTYNSYNGIFSVPRVREWDPWLDTVDESHSEARRGECKACEKTAGGCDLAGEFYRRNPYVSGVPAEYGDTATGQHAADAELIAAMHPDVVLALADWLEATCRHTYQLGEPEEYLDPDLARAVALARLVLEAK
jgi:hypothetical protein